MLKNKSADARSRAAITWPANIFSPKSMVKRKKKSKKDRTSSSSQTRSNQFVKVNQYLNLKLIGRGSYGSVYKCLDTETKIEYAIKEFESR